jgi:hypothetical protein
MTRWLVALIIVGCGNPAVIAPGGSSAGTAGSAGATSGVRPTGTACDAARAKVAQLYRASARGKQPARVEEIVADNTTMVMNDCVASPDKIAACVAAATTVSELEARCLIPLDDEGSEGDRRAQ